VAQKLLGHADIKSTMVYAHAIEDDVRKALVDVHRNSPELAIPDTAKAVTDQFTKVR